jgi:hypothetical protein
MLYTDQQLEEIARSNIERHLGDVAAEYEDESTLVGGLYEEAYTLGFDALADAGVYHEKAGQIAQRVAQRWVVEWYRDSEPISNGRL